MCYSKSSIKGFLLCMFTSFFFTIACEKQEVGDLSTSAQSTSINEFATASPGEAGAVTLPSQILNLTNWKITLPIDGRGSQSGEATEVKQPTLNSYSISPYFKVTSTGTGVLFRANCGGATTSGSGYPRSELREMKNNGTTNASWSSGSGTHTMEIDQSIKKLPLQKPQMIVGQVFGTSDDIITFKISGKTLYVQADDVNKATLNSNYTLGTRFKVKFVVSGNKVKCYYNGVLKYTYNKTFTGYFKAGAYVLSSCKGSKKVSGESCDAFGEVVIYNVSVSHN
jgi:hypothetical protein